MRAKNVKIFTFGIKNGNVRELTDMASPPKNETCYILNSFEEFEALARRALHEDLHGGSYSTQISSKCDKLCRDGRDCCDTKAFCTCGTHIGNYECLCQKGYYGNGLKGGCLPCPSGTYKNVSTPGGIQSCTPCPDENHMTEEGATLIDQCSCKTGFRKFGEKRCASLKCDKLDAPKSGYFVNNKCTNNFNAACGTRCEPGYYLKGDSVRICQEDGKWSGNASECRMKVCPYLPTPKDGNRICSRGNFTFGTVCRFTCDKGYKLIGSRRRTCLAIAYWSGITTRCREITCQHLNEIEFGSVTPEVCTGGGQVPFGTTCKLACDKGFTLIGSTNKLCTPDGVWTPVNTEASRCVDTNPPHIFCPEDIEVDAEEHMGTANVSWVLPLAYDNSGLVPTMSTIPAVEPPTRFPIGVSEVTYIAEDASKNKEECKFKVIVKDTQPPRVDRCPGSITVVSKESEVNVDWEEPAFSDNSNEPVRITKSHEPNSAFQQGITYVTYRAFDQADNVNNCTIEIHIIEHKCIIPVAPINGMRNCYKGDTGVHCSLQCMEGYAFAMIPASEYFCSFTDHKWTPTDQLPFPDCSVQRISNDLIQPARLTFMGKLSCNERTALNRIKDNFEHRVTQLVNSMCKDNMECNVADVHTNCENDSDFNKIRLNLGRTKRSLPGEAWSSSMLIGRREKRQLQEKLNRFTFNFELEGILKDDGNITDDIGQQEEVMKNIITILDQLQTDAKNMSLDLGLVFTNMTYDTNLSKFSCKPGSVQIKNKCVMCPVGTFYNVVTKHCQSCEKGTYQHQDGMVTCMVCPEKTSTTSNHSKTVDECQAQCLPGSFSHDGLEFCETCPVGYYQSEYAQRECQQCPNGTSTRGRGNRLEDSCHAFCQIGYVSETGLEPCLACLNGTYQSEEGKTSCFLCPNKSPTTNVASTKIQDCIDWEVQGDTFFGQTQKRARVAVNLCFTLPCRNGGTCIQKGIGYTCLCPLGFGGSNCKEIVDSCKAKPCLNNGTCFNIGGSYKCYCKFGFSGKKCEFDLDACLSSPCRNGGLCTDLASGFKCSCYTGFEGATCETNIDECATNPCLNKGTCRDFIGRYSCTCATGYTGVDCEIDEDECLAAPCQNNATCHDEGSDYRCECLPGFTGKKCEQEVKECASDPCQNAGTCEERINGYTCHCHAKYTGINCESDVDEKYMLQFDSASTTSYAALTLPKPLNAFTLSFWMKTTDTVNYGTPISYATPETDNFLSIVDYTGFVLYINDDIGSTDIVANDGIWHHITVAWSNVFGDWKFYLDAVLINTGTGLAKGVTIPANGLFVVGQEQDVMGGGFNQREAFIGSIGQINLWNYQLPLFKIESMLTSCDDMGNVIGWPEFQSALHGEVKKIPEKFCSDCESPQNPLYGKVQFADNTTGSNAIFSCFTGYILVGETERMCLSTGDWSFLKPRCEKISCGRPRTVQNGRFFGLRYTYDSRVRYICNRGYRLVGANMTYCSADGEWSKETPTCVEILCIMPVLSKHTLVYSERPKYKSGHRANFYCSKGYNMITSHSTLVCQSDGTWDRGVPTCDGTQCGRPPIIENASIKYKAKEKYFVGDSVNFECNFGYVLENVTSGGVVRCLPDGKWQTLLPKCVIIDCGKPPEVTHARAVYDKTEYLQTVQYICDSGYKISTTELLECLEEGDWGIRVPECLPITCQRPESVNNVEIIASSYTYQSSLTYKCKTGFTLIGIEKRNCQANGTWSGSSPFCDPVHCPKPKDIENGYTIPGIYTFGKTVRYKCNPGYFILDTSEILCGSNGTWLDSPPTCSQGSCNPPPDIENGNFNESDTLLTLGTTVEYSCFDGYVLVGDKSVECNTNLTWIPDSPECRPANCSTPDTIDNGIMQVDGLEFGQIVEYECLSNYRLVGFVSRVCQANETWSGEAPKCVPLTCKEPPSVDNGSPVYTELKVGSTVRYICDIGYYLAGDKISICLSDLTWSDADVICDPIQCVNPLEIDHGSRKFTSRTYESVVRYQCDEGFQLVGTLKRVCTENKTWSEEAPKCNSIRCNSPSFVISNGRMHGLNFSYGAGIYYTCNSGYTSSGPMNRTCQANGEWKNPIPVCERVECPRFKMKSGRLSTFKRDFGTRLIVTCFYGYTLVGRSAMECLSNGSWSGEHLPVCARNCRYPPSIPNGKFKYTSLKHSHNVTYSCYYNYELVGNQNRTCLITGQWSGDAPSCIRRRCPNLTPVLNGTVRKISKGAYVYAEYKCNFGYKLVGNSTLQCLKNAWVPANAPTCIKSECPELNIEHAQLSTTKRSIGTTVFFGCSEGYSMRGIAYLLCKASLEWEGKWPNCDPVGCILPENILNGYINKRGKAIEEVLLQKTSKKKSSSRSATYTIGNVITYSCLPGYTLVGNSTRRCVDGYTWSGNEPECTNVLCPKLEIAHGFTFRSYYRSPGSKLTYRCEVNYTPRGLTTLTCSSSGEWIGDTPICDKNTCPVLIPPLNGNFTSTDRTVGTRLRLVCDRGFEPSTSYFIICFPSQRWSQQNLNCKRISCNSPGLIENGRIIGTDRDFNSTIEYVCNKGFRLVGSSERICEADRNWSGNNTKCEKITCGIPPTVANGFYTGDKDSNSSMQEIRYWCTEGYIMIGEPMVSCGEDGVWNMSDVVCKEIRCPMRVQLENGLMTVQTEQENILYSILKFSCDIGYILNGSSILECQLSETWNGTWPECQPISCSDPGRLQNGNVLKSNGLTYGSRITYVCSENYILSGNAVRMCQANGSWTKEQPECILNVCPMLLKPAFGVVRSANYKVGTEAFYYCEEGFLISGPSKRQCLANRSWSDEEPVCEKIQCQKPQLKDGIVTMTTLSLLEEKAEYECDAGYSLNPSSVTFQYCLKGKWIGISPTCVPVKCPQPPSVKHGFFEDGDFFYKSIVRYNCTKGHEMVGVDFLLCDRNGEYLGNIPECRPSMCGPLPAIRYATTTTSMTNEKLFIMCNDGYRLDGDAMIWCLPNKTWPFIDSKCIPIECGQPPDLERAVVSLPNGTIYGAFAEYKCLTGLDIKGQNRSMCQDDETWETMEYTKCEIINCGPPSLKPHANYIGDTFLFEFNVYFVCEKGYIRNGAFFSFCLETGKWSKESPDCKPVSCRDPPKVPNDVYVERSEGTDYSNVIEYACYGRLMPEGPTSVQCQADGTWNGTAPSCYSPPPVQCGRPVVKDPMSLKLVGSSYMEGNSVFYLCRSGLTPIRRPARLVCLSNGSWDGEAVCKIHCKFSCLNGGRCIGLNRCKCFTGYAGSRCQRAICILPCLNGGYCTSPYKCSCRLGYGGNRCEHVHCKRKCENGGRCIVGRKCHCLNGFKQPICSERRLLMNTTITSSQPTIIVKFVDVEYPSETVPTVVVNHVDDPSLTKSPVIVKHDLDLDYPSVTNSPVVVEHDADLDYPSETESPVVVEHDADLDYPSETKSGVVAEYEHELDYPSETESPVIAEYDHELEYPSETRPPLFVKLDRYVDHPSKTRYNRRGIIS